MNCRKDLVDYHIIASIWNIYSTFGQYTHLYIYLCVYMKGKGTVSFNICPQIQKVFKYHENTHILQVCI